MFYFIKMQTYSFCDKGCDSLITTSNCKCGEFIKCLNCGVVHEATPSNDSDQFVTCPTCMYSKKTIMNTFPDEWDMNPQERTITMTFNINDSENLNKTNTTFNFNRKLVVKANIVNDMHLLKGITIPQY